MRAHRQRAERSARVAPLTCRLLARALDGRGWRYRIDSDANIHAVWGGFVFRVLREGPRRDTLTVQAEWARDVSIAARERILDVANDWNRRHPWPTLTVRVSDDGRLNVRARSCLDCSLGTTVAYLDAHLSGAVAGAFAAFDALDALYPSEAADARSRFHSTERPRPV